MADRKQGAGLSSGSSAAVHKDNSRQTPSLKGCGLQLFSEFIFRIIFIYFHVLKNVCTSLPLQISSGVFPAINI